MQLLTRLDTSGYDAWRAAFDEDAEGRRTAGLSLLQIWRDASAPDTVLCLFEASDRARAEAYLRQRDQLGHGLGHATFLRTA